MIALLALAATPTGSSILRAADAFDQAQLTKDQAAMERMILDDLVFIDGSGKRLGKKELIAGWMAPGDRFDPAAPVDRTVTPLGRDAAVVGAEVNLCGTSDGVRFCSRIRFADTFVRVGGRWRVAHIQVTRIADSGG
ncbi:MAG: nuclear transport factor 2 family protein [Sphingomicrobium sp.]